MQAESLSSELHEVLPLRNKCVNNKAKLFDIKAIKSTAFNFCFSINLLGQNLQIFRLATSPSSLA